MMKTWIEDYLQKQQEALRNLSVQKVNQAIQMVCHAIKKDHQIFVCGNGGSAANASHFATDLGKGAADARPKKLKRIRVLSLTDNVPWITALANDYDYSQVFVQQLRSYARKGDLLIGVSVSGNSPNVVEALRWAADHGLRTIALTGIKPCEAWEHADLVVGVLSHHYGRVEDTQMTVLHMICYAIIENPRIA